MIIYSIYKCVNLINGKVYIGFDSSWPNRKRQHKALLNSKNCPDYAFYKALKKYGWKNFEWSVIYQSKDGDHCLNHMEKYFIELYNSNVHFSDSNGYNMTLGGEGTFGKKQPEKNKIKQSILITNKNKMSRWYNNGLENTFSVKCPGSEWKLGRINQKPTTKGYKWYNNGVNQLLTDKPPDGWNMGMLK